MRKTTMRKRLLAVGIGLLALVGTTLTGVQTASAAVLSAPSNLHVSTPVPTNTTIDIGWNSVAGATGYRVIRYGENPYVTTVTRTHFQFTLLKPGTSYLITVATVNSSGTSAAVSVTLSTTGAPPSGSTVTIGIGSVRPQNSLQPYAPYYSSGIGTNAGGHDCTLYYHEYGVTSGCGGAWATATVYGVDYSDSGRVRMSADFGRTFGCTNSVTKAFTTVMVVRDAQLYLDGAMLSGSYATEADGGGGAASGIRLAGPAMTFSQYLNFWPVGFTCPDGSYRTQRGVKVSNLKVSVTSDIKGLLATTSFAGPWYS